MGYSKMYFAPKCASTQGQADCSLRETFRKAGSNMCCKEFMKTLGCIS
jgi:hypothetical protein